LDKASPRPVKAKPPRASKSPTKEAKVQLPPKANATKAKSANSNQPKPKCPKSKHPKAKHLGRWAVKTIEREPVPPEKVRIIPLARKTKWPQTNWKDRQRSIEKARSTVKYGLEHPY
jgi:hypothetical protein